MTTRLTTLPVAPAPEPITRGPHRFGAPDDAGASAPGMVRGDANASSVATAAGPVGAPPARPENRGTTMSRVIPDPASALTTTRTPGTVGKSGPIGHRGHLGRDEPNGRRRAVSRRDGPGRGQNREDS